MGKCKVAVGNEKRRKILTRGKEAAFWLSLKEFGFNRWGCRLQAIVV